MSSEINETEDNVLWTIGQKLKQAREQKKLSLAEVAETTRISLPLLEGIEEGYIEGNPGGVFVRGFIRTYAALVGIPEEEFKDALTRLSQQEHGQDNQPAPAQEQTNWVLPGVLVAVAFISILAVVLSTEEPTPTEQNNTVVADIEEMPSPSLKMDLQIHDFTWLGVQIDDDPPFEVKANAETELSWSAYEQIQLLIGNSKALTILKNGEPVSLDTSKTLIENYVIRN